MKGREVINHIVREVMPDIEKVRGNCHNLAARNEKRGGNTMRIRKLIPAAAAIMVLLAATTTVFAFGGFDRFMQRFNPTFGTIVEPVMLYSEDQGIRITVIGAQRFDNRAIAYLSVQDVSGENRLTAQTTFRDGLSARQAWGDGRGGGSTGSRLLHFDEMTNTAYFEFTFSADPRSPFVDPLTIRAFMVHFGSERYEGPLSVSLAGLTEAEETLAPDNVFMGRLGLGEYAHLLPMPTHVLVPGYYGPLPHGRDSQWISNVGIIDGQLRVQMAQHFLRGEFGPNFPPQLYLIPPGMDACEAMDAHWASTYIAVDFYLDAEHNIVCTSHDRFREVAVYRVFERIFDVNPEQLPYYTIGYFGSVTRGVEGDWQFVVNTGDTGQQMLVWEEEVTAGDLVFEFMTLSPLGLQVVGRYTGEVLPFPEVEAVVEIGGGIVNFPGGGYSSYDWQFGMGWRTLSPLDVAEVTAVIINDVRIPRP